MSLIYTGHYDYYNYVYSFNSLLLLKTKLLKSMTNSLFLKTNKAVVVT